MTIFAAMVLGPLLRHLWTLQQCALIIDLWHATSLWVMEKAATVMIGDSVDMIGMRCNLMKRVRGSGQCCSTLPVLTGLLTLTHIWHFRMHTSYTLLGNVLRNSASQRKRLGLPITRWNSFDRSAPPRECGRNFDASGDGMRCEESLWYGELCKVAKSHFHIANAASANVCHAERHCKREGDVTFGAELKKSLENDKIQHVHTMVKSCPCRTCDW